MQLKGTNFKGSGVTCEGLTLHTKLDDLEAPMRQGILIISCSSLAAFGVLPLDEKAGLAITRPPTASRSAHRYARTQRPLFGTC